MEPACQRCLASAELRSPAAGLLQMAPLCLPCRPQLAEFNPLDAESIGRVLKRGSRVVLVVGDQVRWAGAGGS